MLPGFKDYSGQPIRVIEVKADGHSISIDTRDELRVLTKNRKDITRKLMMHPLIWETLSELGSGSFFLAELHAPGIPATSVPTLINSGDTRLQMMTFAAPYVHDHDMREEPIPYIHNVIAELGMTPPTIQKCWQDPVSLSEDLQKELLAEAVARRIEGWVCKLHHMEGWYKLKPVKTVDAFVIGTETSTEASHYGGLKSIAVAVWNGKHIEEIASVGSGFEQEYRMSVDRKSLMYKVAEVAYDCVAADGKLRFPRFIRWREDKDWRQCTKDQLK